MQFPDKTNTKTFSAVYEKFEIERNKNIGGILAVLQKEINFPKAIKPVIFKTFLRSSGVTFFGKEQISKKISLFVDGTNKTIYVEHSDPDKTPEVYTYHDEQNLRRLIFIDSAPPKPPDLLLWFQIAISSENKAISSSFIKAIIDRKLFNAEVAEGGSILHYYAANNDISSIERLFSVFGKSIDINAKTLSGSTALIFAVLNNQPEIIKLLFEKGADLNLKDSNGLAPINHAVTAGNLKIIKLLAKFNADLNAKTNSGNAPIHHAARNGKLKVVNLLSENGADLNTQDSFGNTPLHWATRYEKSKITTFLIEKGANLDAQNDLGDTPITYAIRNRNLEVVKLFIKRGANLSIKNSVGLFPIHFAASSENLEILECFLSLNVDVNVKSEAGYTPLFFAISDGRLELVRLLVEKGARFYNESFCINPVLLAVEKGFVEITDFLVNYPDFVPLGNETTEEITIAAFSNYFEILEILLRSGKFRVEQSLSVYLDDAILHDAIPSEKVQSFQTIRGILRRYSAGSPEDDELSDASEDSESPTEPEPSGDENEDEVDGTLPLSEDLVRSTPPPPPQVEFNYLESVENQLLKWRRIERFRPKRKCMPFILDTHTDRPVNANSHAHSFFQSLLDVVKRENYSGEIIIISGQGRHSKNGISKVKLKIMDLAKKQGIYCQEIPDNPGRLRLKALDGMFVE
jgi:ankyrin repeat protein